MSKQEITNCDRCKKTIDIPVIQISLFGPPDFESALEDDIDLCERCLKQFRIFMKDVPRFRLFEGDDKDAW
jgi:hypothetical protein